MTERQPATRQEDHTGFRYPGPAVEAPSPTILWRARTAATAIKTLLAELDQQRPALSADARAQIDAITDRFLRVTAGASVDRDDVPWLEETEQELRAIAAKAAPTGPAVPVPVVLDAEPDEDTGELQIAFLIRAERTHLPETSRLPWRDRPAKRRVRAWTKAWRQLQHEPVDMDKVLAAWQAYGRVAQPQAQSAAQLGPAVNPQPEGA